MTIASTKKTIGRAVALALLLVPAVRAANTDPSLALMRAAAATADSGRITITLEASVSFADTVQLGLPLDIVVVQGTRSAHFALSGEVALSVDGGPLQPAPPPGVLAVSNRTIVLVLPAQFAAGEASAQIVATYGGDSLASNRLRFTI
jgi:hypothetical protein